MNERIYEHTKARGLVGTAALALTLTCLLSGCSGDQTPSQGAAPSVASVPKASVAAKVEPGAEGTTAPAAVEPNGPLIRADTSFEDFERFQNAYRSCLVDEDVPAEAADSLMRGGQYVEEAAKYVSARKACASKEPEDYKVRERRLNPEAWKDKVREQVRCMRSHGLKIEVSEDGTWGFPDASAAEGLDSPHVKSCEIEAFGAG